MRTIRTPKKRQLFLEALRNSANVRIACLRSSISRRAAYEWRRDDQEFAREWNDVIEDAVDLLEAEAWQRARGGTSDTLLIFLLKAHRPAVYRETFNHQIVVEAREIDAAIESGLAKLSARRQAADDPQP